MTSIRRVSSARRGVARGLAGVGLVFVAFFFGLVFADSVGIAPSRSVPGGDDPAPSPAALAGAAAPDDVGHAVAAATVVVLAGAGLVGLIVRPSAAGFGWHVAATAAAIILSGVMVGNPDNRGGQAGALDPLPLILATPMLLAVFASTPWRAPPAERPSTAEIVLVAIGAIAATWFGVDQALLQRHTFPPAADPHHNAHWWAASMAALLVAAVAGAGLSGRPGWRTGTMLSGIAAAIAATISLLRPAAASALPAAGAAATFAWGAAVVWFAMTRGHPSGRMQHRNVWLPRDEAP